MTNAKKPWTILVWIAGDNDLSKFGGYDLDELKQVGSGARLNLVAQYDRAGAAGTRRYLLRKGTTLKDDMVADLGETNCGDPAVAIDFFTWGIANYPSDHVMCVLWNHGSGIDESDVYARARALAKTDAPGDAVTISRAQARAVAKAMSRALFSTTIDQALRSKAIAFDDTSRDFLDNTELSDVVATVAQRAGRKIDVVGFDACLMNMVEIAYQLREHVSFLVGSEELEPSEGWPYDKVAAAAAKASAAKPAKLVEAIVKAYVESYADNPQEDRLTQSGLDLSKVGPLAAAIDQLAVACLDNLQPAEEYRALSQAATNALRFNTRDFVDLGDLCSQLVKRSTNAEVIEAAKAVLTALNGPGGAVVANRTQGDGVVAASGTTIYFPMVGDAHLVYPNLAFARDTRWPALLTKFRNG